jgi:hypothetical protein
MGARKYFTEEERRAGARAVTARWRQANRKRHCANVAKWARAHPDHVRATKRKYYLAHAAVFRARTAEWKKKNPDRRAQQNAINTVNRRKHKFFIAGCVLIDALAAGGDETKRQGGT